MLAAVRRKRHVVPALRSASPCVRMMKGRSDHASCAAIQSTSRRVSQFDEGLVGDEHGLPPSMSARAERV